MQFDAAGFFAQDLKVVPFAKDHEFATYIKEQLSNPAVAGPLGEALVSQRHVQAASATRFKFFLNSSSGVCHLRDFLGVSL